ncbi:MAG: ABC transporter permease [Bryobacteraceae bacterium]
MTLWQDVLFGLRLLRTKPGFTAVAALSLALGIGANTAIFSIVNTVLLTSLAYRDPSRLVMIETTPPGHPEQSDTATVPDFIAWRDQSRSFESLGAGDIDAKEFGAGENGTAPERIEGEEFSPGVFRALGVPPLMGRTFTDEEDAVDSPATVLVISHRLWQRRYGGDPNIVNKTIQLTRGTATIIGVMPPGFHFVNEKAEYWMPLSINHFQLQGSGTYLSVVARLKPGVSIEQAREEMKSIADQLARNFPTRNKGRGLRVEPLHDAIFGWMKQPLGMLEGVVAFVLLIACANVAGLQLARGQSRRAEIALRAALGAGRWRIVRQFLVESVLLSLLGGLLGVAFAWAGLRLLIAISPSWFPMLDHIGISWGVLAFTAALSIVAGIAFGIVPAWRASRPNLADSLKDAGRGSLGPGHHRLRGALVAGQIALALILLAGAGLMINSFLRITGAELGCKPSGVITFEYDFPVSQNVKMIGSYHNFPLLDVNPLPAQKFDRLYDRIRALPGVQSAAGSVLMPVVDEMDAFTFTIQGRPVPQNDAQRNAMSAVVFPVTPGLFTTIRAPLLRGRDFTARDIASAPWVAIVNQTMARTFWPNEDPIGKRITLDLVPEERPRQIVGIAPDIKVGVLQKKPEPAMYISHLQRPPHVRGPYQWTRAYMTYLVRPSGSAASVIPQLRQAVAEMDPSRPVGNFRTMDEALATEVKEPRYYMLLLSIFAGIATLLATVGIYGVMAHSVAERTREIGIRMALGAHWRDVIQLVMGSALLLIATGLVVGLGGSLALTRLIAFRLWGVTATDPATFASVALLLAVVAVLATLIPVRRAMRVDPTVALRYE